MVGCVFTGELAVATAVIHNSDRALVLAAPVAVSQEPRIEDTADLIRASHGLGTVARLDHFHAALVAAYRAGQRHPHDQ